MSKEKTLAKALQRYRRQNGRLNQTKLAQRLGVTTRTLQGWEAMTSYPTGANLTAIEDLLQREF